MLVLVESNLDKFNTLGGEFDFTKDYIDDAKDASQDEDLLESYDKEWALKDQALRDGIAQGIEQAHLEMAIELLKRNIPKSEVVAITKLSLEEIEELDLNKSVE